MKQLTVFQLFSSLLFSCANDNENKAINTLESAVKDDLKKFSIDNSSYIII